MNPDVMAIIIFGFWMAGTIISIIIMNTALKLTDEVTEDAFSNICLISFLAWWFILLAVLVIAFQALINKISESIIRRVKR